MNKNSFKFNLRLKNKNQLIKNKKDNKQLYNNRVQKNYIILKIRKF